MDYNRIRRKGFVRTRDNIPVKYADPEKGLTAEQVELRRACGWSNTPPAGAGRTEQDIVKAHTLTVFNLVFLVLAAALLLVGSDPKNLVFLIVVVCNTVIGIVQELRSKRLVDKLTLIADQRVPTVREGNLETLTPEQLVRDDIVELSAGDHICADAMIRTGELQVNESLITGESTAVLKRPGDELKSGTFVLAGRARVQLTGVGSDAMVARLTAQVREDPGLRKSEMMSALDRLIRIIGYLLVPVGILLFLQPAASILLSRSIRQLPTEIYFGLPAATEMISSALQLEKAIPSPPEILSSVVGRYISRRSGQLKKASRPMEAMPSETVIDVNPPTFSKAKSSISVTGRPLYFVATTIFLSVQVPIPMRSA
jgi:magnesium-transporting ATPase (P-type)